MDLPPPPSSSSFFVFLIAIVFSSARYAQSLLEKHRSNYTYIDESSTLLLDSTSVPPNIITANENEFNPNEQEEDPLEGINIQPWELEHAEAELAELRCPILPRAADADYSPSIPKKCSGKTKPVPADHNDQMLQLMSSLA